MLRRDTRDPSPRTAHRGAPTTRDHPAELRVRRRLRRHARRGAALGMPGADSASARRGRSPRVVRRAPARGRAPRLPRPSRRDVNRQQDPPPSSCAFGSSSDLHVELPGNTISPLAPDARLVILAGDLAPAHTRSVTLLGISSDTGTPRRTMRDSNARQCGLDRMRRKICPKDGIRGAGHRRGHKGPKQRGREATGSPRRHPDTAHGAFCAVKRKCAER